MCCLAAACEKTDPLGWIASIRAIRGLALAGFLHTQPDGVVQQLGEPLSQAAARPGQDRSLFVATWGASLPKHVKEVVLDLDAMGDLLTAKQEGRYFNGYYDDYLLSCRSTPLSGTSVVGAMRTSDQDAAAGWWRALEKMVRPSAGAAAGRASLCVGHGFGREEIMALGASRRCVLLVWVLARTPC